MPDNPKRGHVDATPDTPEAAGGPETSTPPAGPGPARVRSVGDYTTSPPGAGDPASAETVAVPGYEVEGELGRGGMGVVYKARDRKLNRVVALKMVRGGRVGRGGLIRFLVEAEAVAAVRHPSVVQVYEYGEHDGHPYMALEYLPGGALNLGPAPASFRAVAATLGQVARGVAAAHALGIVHRDLKPGNVLLDEAGNPKVMDFGLAKRPGGTDLTAPDAVMGTPAYMSPEQADGKTKFVGPPADVWALGVMLYEALTGVRPFRGDDTRGVLAQVLTADPVPPRKRAPAVPRDLDLICRKCLSKAAHERYPTARELADDLEAFAAGRPISVRPAGPLERGYKWVKRNRVVSGALAAAVLALLTGAALSVAFGLDARGEAKRADGERNDAVAARNDLAKANTDLGKANDELGGALAREHKANDDLTGALARALLGPVESQRGTQQRLSPPEIPAFWELASNRGRAVNLRFLEEATRTPAGCLQLANRAEFALHAAIGLDCALRDRVDQLFLTRLRVDGLTSWQRVDLARACSHLGSLSSDTADATAAGLTHNLSEINYPPFVYESTRGLERVVGRMRPTAVAAASQAVTQVMKRPVDVMNLIPLAQGRVALASHLDPVAAVDCDHVAQRVVGAMQKLAPTKAWVRMEDMAEALAVLAPHLSPAVATQHCEAAAQLLTDAMRKRVMDPDALRRWAGGVRALAPHLGPAAAAAAAGTLADGMEKTTDPSSLKGLATGFAALTPRLDLSVAGRVRDRAARVLTARVRAATSPHEVQTLAQGLGALAGRLEPGTAAAAAAALADALVAAADSSAIKPMARTLGALAGRLEPGTAAAAAAALADALTKTTDPFVLGGLAWGLGALAPRLDAAAAARVCDRAARTLADALAKTTDLDEQGYLAWGLGALAPRLDAAAAARVCDRAARTLADAVRDVMQKPNFRPEVEALAEGLSAVAGWTGPDAQTMTTTWALIEARSMCGLWVSDTNVSAALASGVRAGVLGMPVCDQDRGIRSGALAAGALGAPLPGLPLAHPSFCPQPRPLLPQMLVDLLKHPFCIGDGRRAVLDALGHTYDRRFADQWDFVDYARTHQPQLDLLTPPKRPDPTP